MSRAGRLLDLIQLLRRHRYPVSGEKLAAERELDLSAIREAIRSERKLDITYLDLNAVETRRTIWPFALAFFDRARVAVAWCELRQGFRHFRIDRISALTLSELRYPRRRQVLLQEWRKVEGIPPQ